MNLDQANMAWAERDMRAGDPEAVGTLRIAIQEFQQAIVRDFGPDEDREQRVDGYYRRISDLQAALTRASPVQADPLLNHEVTLVEAVETPSGVIPAASEGVIVQVHGAGDVVSVDFDEPVDATETVSTQVLDVGPVAKDDEA